MFPFYLLNIILRTFALHVMLSILSMFQSNFKRRQIFNNSVDVGRYGPRGRSQFERLSGLSRNSFNNCLKLVKSIWLSSLFQFVINSINIISLPQLTPSNPYSLSNAFNTIFRSNIFNDVHPFSFAAFVHSAKKSISSLLRSFLRKYKYIFLNIKASKMYPFHPIEKKKRRNVKYVKQIKYVWFNPLSLLLVIPVNRLNRLNMCCISCISRNGWNSGKGNQLKKRKKNTKYRGRTEHTEQSGFCTSLFLFFLFIAGILSISTCKL